jgi:hypothetical protein
MSSIKPNSCLYYIGCLSSQPHYVVSPSNILEVCKPIPGRLMNGNYIITDANMQLRLGVDVRLSDMDYHYPFSDLVNVECGTYIVYHDGEFIILGSTEKGVDSYGFKNKI